MTCYPRLKVEQKFHKDEIWLACESETGGFLSDKSRPVEVRSTLIHLFLYLKNEVSQAVKIDKLLSEKIIKVFAETLANQYYDTYLVLQRQANLKFHMLVRIDLEFSLLWLKVMDQLTVEKVKRVRELTNQHLTEAKVPSGDKFMQTLSSYLLGAGMKYSCIIKF